MNVVLLTGRDPNALTGGSIYHRRIAERAARFGVEVDIRPLGGHGDVEPSTQADVVVVDSLVASRVRPGAFAAQVVASVHQLPGGLTGPRPVRAVRATRDLRLYRHADAVIVPSAFLREALARAGVAPDVVRVVEPGSETVLGRQPPSQPPSGRRRGGVVRFVTVANLSAHKRSLDAIEAFARLGDVPASLTLIGAVVDRRLGRRVRDRLERPDLAGRARWIGPLPPAGVAGELASADVFVLPAIDESYGMAVAEAMRAGLPAIVARSGNLPSLVRDGVDGLVVPPRDVRSLAGAMRGLALDRSRLDAMGAAASRSAERFPTWDDAADAFCAVVRSVQASAAAPRSGARRSAA
ncbi:MAG: glycosyltransferase family 4 protein [Actinomycetota bacterium]